MRHPNLFSSIAAATGIVVLAACAPGSDTGNGEASGPSADDVETDIASLGDITLTLWDQEVRGAQNEAIETLIAEFEEEYPNVTVDRVSQSFDDLQRQTALALSGNDVPDVLQVNNARSSMGEFVSADQLTDLTRYAEVYDWEGRFPEDVLAKTRYSTDGVEFGEGALWGVPQTGEVVGIYYNAGTLEELGVDAPSTWEELFEIISSAQDAGERPVALGNLEGWPALHVFGPLQAHFVPPEEINTLGMGNAGADWTSDANVDALTQFANWGSDGVLGDSPNGEDYDAAWVDFVEGAGTLLIGGSWLGPDMANAMGEEDDLHFMVPPPGDDGSVATTGGTGIPFSVPAQSENADAAAAFIDFITNEDAMEIIADNGGLPVLNAADLAPDSGLNREIYEAFDAVSTEGTLLPYLDYATPSFGDTAAETLQELIGGQTTPEEAAETLQEDYSEFTEQG